MDVSLQQRLVGQLSMDKAFRENLLKDPENTLRANGYPVEPEVVEAIRRLTPELVNEIAKDVSKGYYQTAQ